MADLDSLLDGPPAPAAPATTGAVDIDELDSLIGSTPPTAAQPRAESRELLEDDFLGDARRVTGSFVSMGSSGSNHLAGVSPTKRGPMSKPSIPPLSAAPSDKLKPFVTPDTTYFARFVSLYDRDLKRTRAVITLTENTLQILQPSNQAVLRTIPVDRINGVLKQPLLVSKTFGFSKEYELHMVIQVEHERDVYLALSFDTDNGSNAASLDIVQTLSAISMSHGVALSVSELHQDESIDSMVKWSDGEDRIRRQYSETLAYRTELSSELQTVTRKAGQVVTAIETLKASTAAQAAEDLHKDMDAIRKTIAEFTVKYESIDRSKSETMKLLKSLQGELEREENRRAIKVRESMELTAQTTLMRQVAEYEIMKAAHKREVDKLNALTSFDERRVGARGNQLVFRGNELGLRIDDLEDEEAQLIELRTTAAQQNSNATVALTEAKKRLAQAKSTLLGLTDDIATLQKLPIGQPLPADMSLEPAPTFDTVQMSQAAPTAPKTATPKPAVPSPPPAAAAPPAAKKPIILLDDDDI